MSKDRSGKQIRHLKAEIKRLQAEIKRLKRQPLDKDEEIPNTAGCEPCMSCPGIMYQTEMVGRTYWRCLSCGRTKSLTK